MVKVLIIGWDGATWDIATRLMEKGKMPNLKKLVENGAWGPLESSILLGQYLRGALCVLD